MDPLVKLYWQLSSSYYATDERTLDSFPTRRSSDLWRKMRKFDLSLRSSRSSYFATFRHQLTILSKTDALDDGERSQSKSFSRDRKSGSAGMPRPISYAVFCLKKKKNNGNQADTQNHEYSTEV